MELDRNYALKREKSDVYSDSFDEIVDLIAKAKASSSITDEQAQIILKIAAERQGKKEINRFFRTLFDHSDQFEKHALFIHLKTNRVKYV